MRRPCSVSVSTIWLFSTAVITLRAVVPGSVITKADAEPRLTHRTATSTNPATRRLRDILIDLRLLLAPRPQVVRGAANQVPPGRAAVTHATQAHVHGRGFGIPEPLGPHQKLLQGVRQQLIGR